MKFRNINPINKLRGDDNDKGLNKKKSGRRQQHV